jgi:hypothetical protein
MSIAKKGRDKRERERENTTTINAFTTKNNTLPFDKNGRE